MNFFQEIISTMTYIKYFLLIFSSCAPGFTPLDFFINKTKDNRQFKGIHEDFQPYVKDFESFYGVKINNVPIGYDNNTNLAGYCTTYTFSGLKEIGINQKTFNKYTDEQKRMLIFHELAHCVWNKHHNTKFLEDGCPESIMFPSIFSTYCYNQHEQHYLNELNK